MQIRFWFNLEIIAKWISLVQMRQGRQANLRIAGRAGMKGGQEKIMARQTRIERATPAFGGLYSIQLSYWRVGYAWKCISET